MSPKPPLPVVTGLLVIGTVGLMAAVLGFVIPEMFAFVKWAGDILIAGLK